MYDIVLKNGLIVDGLRNKPYVGDVAIKDGKIAAVGAVDDSAKEYVDVTGMVVSPGFIDMHSHSDISPMISTEMASKICQGVTTEVIGHCGISLIPACGKNRQLNYETFASLDAVFDDPYYAADNLTQYKVYIEGNKKPATNLVPLVGHGAVRSYVMGFEDREPTEEELEQMKVLLEEELNNGAWGMTLGLIYPPGIFSKKDELIELARVIAKHNKILCVHMRDEGSGIFEAVDEMIHVARESKVHLHISHLKLLARPVWHQAKKLLKKIQDARDEGLIITADQYPYTASSTSLTVLLPIWASIQGVTGIADLLRDEEKKSLLLHDITAILEEYGGPSCVQIASTGGLFKEAENRRLDEIARELGQSSEETILYMLHRCNGRVACVYHSIDQDDVLKIMQDMQISIGSDSIAFPFDAAVVGDAPHPRNFATFPRFLQTVRETKIMALEDAVYKITGLTAQTIGLTQRGQLTAGAVADITVFGYNAIRDCATYSDPIQKPQGIIHVLVSGQFALKGGVQTANRRGAVIIS